MGKYTVGFDVVLRKFKLDTVGQHPPFFVMDARNHDAAALRDELEVAEVGHIGRSGVVHQVDSALVAPRVQVPHPVARDIVVVLGIGVPEVHGLDLDASGTVEGLRGDEPARLERGPAGETGGTARTWHHGDADSAGTGYRSFHDHGSRLIHGQGPLCRGATWGPGTGPRPLPRCSRL